MRGHMQPWFCDVKRQAKVIDRVMANAKTMEHNRKELLCETVVRIWDKHDIYCLRRGAE